MEYALILFYLLIFFYLYLNALTYVREFLAKLVDAGNNGVQVNDILRECVIISIPDFFDNLL